MWKLKSGLKAAVFSLVLLAAAAGCNRGTTGPDDPRSRLQEYISKSFNAKADGDRKEMIGFLTGDAKTRLSSWSDEQFRQAFLDTKRQFLKLSFREVKNISANEAVVTYELVYLDQSKGRDAKVSNRKLAQMVRENGRWFISDVRNIKELIEYQNEIALP